MHTLAADTSIFKVEAVINSCVCTVNQSSLCSSAAHIVKVNRTTALSKEGEGKGHSTCLNESKNKMWLLSTFNVCSYTSPCGTMTF